MATTMTPLTNQADYAAFFRQRVVVNLMYWCDFPAVVQLDIPALDQERDQILRAITFALHLDETWSPTHSLIVTMAPYMERRGLWEAWHTILAEAMTVAERVGDLTDAVDLALLLARLSQRQSQPERTIHYYRHTVALARRNEDPYNEARAWTNLGFFYIETGGQWWRAEVLCCRALAMFQELQSDHGLAHTENHLGCLYNRQRRWELAQAHLERACAIWERMSDDHGLMRGYTNLSVLYQHSGKPDEALHYSQQALTLAQQTGESSETGTIYMNMADIYRRLEKPAQAKVYIQMAERVFRQHYNQEGLANLMNILGLVHLSEGDWSRAQEHLQAGLQAWRELGNTPREVWTLIYLLEYEIATAQWSAAEARLAHIDSLLQQHHHLFDQTDWEVVLAPYRAQWR